MMSIMMMKIIVIMSCAAFDGRRRASVAAPAGWLHPKLDRFSAPSPDLPMMAIAIPSRHSHRPLLRSEEMSSHELIMHFDFVSKNDFNAVENHK